MSAYFILRIWDGMLGTAENVRCPHFRGSLVTTLSSWDRGVLISGVVLYTTLSSWDRGVLISGVVLYTTLSSWDRGVLISGVVLYTTLSSWDRGVLISGYPYRGIPL